MTKKPLWAVVLAALGVSCATAYAQTSAIGPYRAPAAPESGPVAVRLGDSPVYFTPFLNIGAGYDDNVGMTATNETSSPYYVVSPGFLMEARDASKIFRFSYQGAIGQYSDSEKDNYVDHTFRGSLDWAIAPRHALRVGYDYLHGHEARGATDRPAESAYPDKFNTSTPSVLYAFGTQGAQGRVELWYNDAIKRYTNNRTVTVLADRDTQEFGGTFYWRVMPRTHVLLEGRRLDYDYKDPRSPQDSQENKYYVGATWEATAATSGTVKIGSVKKEFDVGPSSTDTSWEALVTWSPRTYSRFDFYTSRQPTESTGQGAFILSSPTGVIWTHSWSSLLSTTVNARYQKDEYQGGTNREDEIKSLGLKVAYKFRRWVTLGAEYTYSQRDSNIPTAEYDRNLWLLTANFTL
jgi:hypothetical protein